MARQAGTAPKEAPRRLAARKRKPLDPRHVALAFMLVEPPTDRALTGWNVIPSSGIPFDQAGRHWALSSYLTDHPEQAGDSW